MTSKKKRTNSGQFLDTASVFGVVFALLIGSFVRLFIVLQADFPLNDGGLIYVMVGDLQRANYALPVYTSYNSAQIPFAYPPLSLYLAALFSDITGWSILDILRLLPAIISALTIPIFYFLGLEILNSKAQAAIAVLAFALLPRNFMYMVMGGGLPRSLGFMFALLAMHQAYLLYTRGQRKYILSTTVLASLTVLSHPEKTALLAFTALVFFVFTGLNKSGIKNSIFVGAGTIFLTAPWWFTVISRHGVTPFLSVLQVSHRGYSMIGPLITFNFSYELTLSMIGVSGLLGLLFCFVNKKYLLPVWLIGIFLIYPRDSSTLASLPLSLLAGIGIANVILSDVGKQDRQDFVESGGISRIAWAETLIESRFSKLFIAAFLWVAIANAFLATISPESPLHPLRPEERESMEWIANNTPETSKFLILGSPSLWSEDRYSEWFPALAERESIITVQGYEWLSGQFHKRWGLHALFEGCGKKDVSCLEEIEKEFGIEYTHIYLVKEHIGSGIVGDYTSLQNSVYSSPNYILLHEDGRVAIFAKRSIHATNKQ